MMAGTWQKTFIGMFQAAMDEVWLPLKPELYVLSCLGSVSSGWYGSTTIGTVGENGSTALSTVASRSLLLRRHQKSAPAMIPRPTTPPTTPPTIPPMCEEAGVEA